MTDAEHSIGKVLLVVAALVLLGVVFGLLFGALSVFIVSASFIIKHHSIPSISLIWHIASARIWATMILCCVGLPLLMGGSWLRDAAKQNGWRTLVPAFIWPTISASEPTLLARLGRVIHWLFVLVAIIVFVIGILFVAQSQSNITSQTQQQIEWDQAHPAPGKPGFVLEQAQDEYGILQTRPKIPDADFEGICWGALAAFITLLIGRGFRYILAGE